MPRRFRRRIVPGVDILPNVHDVNCLGLYDPLHGGARPRPAWASFACTVRRNSGIIVGRSHFD